ncbi:FMN-binding protein [Paludicola sp. MB14-C6]|uniref:FMN-binding protein n=1 Tax=Paludihabitans sp. MB14-C6 TaxID=3070656 RepID=UPI0027DB2BEA|nr:FMN-binding protein [Paludicola sp. MB14-C6]WMJ23302.1 FMN-binding protein [Paludicola sp. MB14-C6]
MKKFMGIALAITMTIVLFVGCASGSKTMKDGKYRAEFKEFTRGWKEYVEVTVKDGKIADVDFDGVNEKGEKKSADPGYKDAMTKAGFKTWPEDFYLKYEKQLVEKQDVTKIDAVAGATTSAGNFKKLVTELSKNLKSGNTKTVIVAVEEKK